MELKVLNEEKDYIELEIFDEKHTLCNSIRKEICDEGDIAGYNIDHPLISNPKLIVKGGNPRKIILNAVDRLKAKNKDFRGKLKKI